METNITEYKANKKDLNWLESLFTEPYGKGKIEADIYFSKEAIQQIGSATPDEAVAAYKAAEKKFPKSGIGHDIASILPDDLTYDFDKARLLEFFDKTRAKWNERTVEAFAKFGDGQGDDFMRALYAMKILAKDKPVKISKLEVTGKQVSLKTEAQPGIEASKPLPDYFNPF
jgi:hypothetical protein